MDSALFFEIYCVLSRTFLRISWTYFVETVVLRCRSQQISCDVRNFVCRGEKLQNKDRLQLFWNKNVLC